MRRLAQYYLPDLLWYIYRWVTNDMRARERFPSLRRYIDFQRQLHKAIWGDR